MACNNAMNIFLDCRRDGELAGGEKCGRVDGRAEVKKKTAVGE